MIREQTPFVKIISNRNIINKKFMTWMSLMDKNKDLNKEKDIFPKLMYKFNITPIKIPTG